MAAGPTSRTFSAEEALLLLKTLTDAECECFSEDSQLESGDEEEDPRVEGMLAGPTLRSIHLVLPPHQLKETLC